MQIKLKPGDTNTSAKGMFIKGDKILIVKPTGSKDRYDIPGGKIKLGESKEQGLYRECFEEIGLKNKTSQILRKDEREREREREKTKFISLLQNGKET